MDPILVLVLIFLISLWLYHRWNHRHLFALAKKVGSSRLQMILGFGPILSSKTIIQKGLENAEKLGQDHLCYIGPYPQFVTGDPDTIKDILTSKLCVFKGDLTYTGLNHALGKGILTMQGSEWLQHRKLIDPAFKPSKLVGFLSIFNKKVKRIFEDMDKCHQMKNSYDILVYCREYTIDVTGETVLGKDFNETTEVNVKHYAQLITRNLKYISDISFKVFYHNNFILNLANLTIFKGARITSEFLANLIDKNIDYYSDGNQPTSQNVKTKDNLVIATVLEALKNDTIGRHLAISSMVHVFSAAFETNSSTMYFVMLMLAMHPEYQERAYAEVCEVFPENDDGEFELTYEHITQLSYLDMFIKETMRLFPTIPHFGRLVVGGDLRLSSGAVLPEGLELIINVYNVHHNKDVWGPQANIFNPDNFLPANMENRHPYAFIPFSKGIRFCLGMRYAEIVLRVTMAKIIKRYKFSTTAKLEDLEIHNHISIQLKEHPPLTIERRANSNKI